MKFFQPQIQLAREAVLDEPDAYFLHVITFCPRTCFRADGHETDGSELANGLYKVILYLCQDPSLPDYNYITPIVHTLALGSIDFPGGEGNIEVQVRGVVLEDDGSGMRGGAKPPATPTNTGGRGTVGTTGADSISKPIDPDSL